MHSQQNIRFCTKVSEGRNLLGGIQKGGGEPVDFQIGNMPKMKQTTNH
jgi:hypothetical protein